MILNRDFRIVVNFDRERLRRYAKRGSPAFFDFRVESNNGSYPDEHWMDFGAVVVGWWIMAALRMRSGSNEEQFLFMDGPHLLTARRRDLIVDFMATDSDFAISVLFEDFVAELKKSAKEIADTLSDSSEFPDEVNSLKKGVKLLESTPTS